MPTPAETSDRARSSGRGIPPFLAGGGESGALIRSIDWSQHALGDWDGWPETLRTTLSIVLSSRHPMVLMWGPQLAVFYNDAYLPSFDEGKHPAAMGMSAYDCWPELWSIVGPEVAAVMERGEASWHRDQLVPMLRHGRLEEIYWTYSYSPVRLADGRVGGLLAVCSETTDRVVADRRVASETEKSARLLQFMPTPFFSVTRDWVLNHVNPAAEEVLGLCARDMVGRPLWEVFPGLVGSRFAEGYQRAMREGLRVVTEDFYPDFQRWYEAWAYPFDEGLAVSFFDVTRRKEIELSLAGEKQKLEAIFYGSASPLVLFRGPELVYEMFNAKYEALVPKRVLAGRPLLEALPELRGTPFPEHIRRVFETGQPILTLEEVAPLIDPDTGQLVDRYFDGAISRVNDGEGRPYGVCVQATDVTDRVHARHRLEQAQAARDTFLSIASHELRTPITSMALRCEMMKRMLARDDGSALTRERVTRLVEQTDSGLARLSRLVGDMLDISRIQGGKLALQPEPTDLVAFAAGVVERFAEELAEAGMPVALAAAPEHIEVRIDRLRMEQVLTNLITNAIRYAPGAAVRVDLSVEGRRARLAFQDTGPGIAAADRERVFERYERLVSASDVSGLGVGLYIARELVRAHGGEITAEAGAPSGARFVVSLPLA